MFSHKVRDDRGFQVNPLCRHDITSPFPPSGNGGYVRNLDVFTSIVIPLMEFFNSPIFLMSAGFINVLINGLIKFYRN